MKKVVHLGWLLLFLFGACQKHEDEIAPADRPDARLAQALTDYKAQLTGAEHGWKAMLYPETGEVYTFLLKFTPNDRVTMTGDINAATGIPAESSYRLKAMQLPALLFDTYSHLHILADPDRDKNGGDEGQGRYVDFEFNFESATAETITLVGQYHNSKLILTKASQAEAASYNANVGAALTAVERLNRFTSYFKRLTIGNKAYDIQVDPISRTLVINYFNGETAAVFTTGFYYTGEGLVLQEPFTHEGQTIQVLQGLQFNAGTSQVNLSINNAAATIREMPRPVKVDVQGARNFFDFATGEEYWVALGGFTVQGVPDALNVRNLPNFEFLALWPKFGTASNVTYDLLGFVTLNAARTGFELNYGPAATSQLTPDGRLVYTSFRHWGDPAMEQNPALVSTREIWTEAQGFYVVRTGNRSIDLVSAKDGQAWLSVFLP